MTTRDKGITLPFLAPVVNVMDAPYNAKNDDSTACDTAVAAAETFAFLTGRKVYFPAGTYKFLNTVNKKGSVDWVGDGMYTSTLKYYGSGVFINAVGTSPSRVICSIRDLRLDGSAASGSAEGFKCGFNMRSLDLLRNVHIYNFPHYGIHFADQNWIIRLTNVSVDTCGRTVTNSAGIFKDAAIDNSTWNEIIFDNVVVEGCGNASSAAGGWNIQTTTANRGIYVVDCGAEGNLGTDEVYFQNLSDLQIVRFYMERINGAGQSVGLDLDGCSGQINGGFISGAGALNLRGIRMANSKFEVTGVNLGFWATASIDIQSSLVHFGQCFTGQTGVIEKLLASNLLISGNSEISGVISPKVHAHKNGTNQLAVANNVFTKVTFGTESYDQTGAYNAGTSVFTPICRGLYQIDAQVTLVADTDQDRPILAVYLNGVLARSAIHQASGTGAYALKISCQLQITAVTDTVEIYVRQSSGVNQDISGSIPDTWFSATYIGQIV